MRRIRCSDESLAFGWEQGLELGVGGSKNRVRRGFADGEDGRDDCGECGGCGGCGGYNAWKRKSEDCANEGGEGQERTAEEQLGR